MNVPSKQKENAIIANKIVHAFKVSLFSATIEECNNAVAASQGIKEAFSTGSQNHQPPHPSSLYAHQEPSAIPIVKNTHAIKVHGLTHLTQIVSTLPTNKAAIEKENVTDNPTYPKYKNGGCIAKPKSCNIGLKPSPSAFGKNILINGLDVNKIKLINAAAIKP